MSQMLRTFRELDDVSHELVSVSGHREDELMVARVFVESLAQRRNMARESVFLNRGPGPDELEQLVLVDDTVAVFDERDEDLEGLGRQRNERVVAPEQTAPSVNNVRTEPISESTHRRRLQFNGFQNFSQHFRDSVTTNRRDRRSVRALCNDVRPHDSSRHNLPVRCFAASSGPSRGCTEEKWSEDTTSRSS